jgi:alkylated DNA repair dioxygenase AlkB
MMAGQGDLFAVGTGAPEGLLYRADVIDRAREAALLEHVRALTLEAFRFHGYMGKRRVASYGWRYDYERERAERGDPMPPFLLELRADAARFAGLAAESLEQALVIEYGAGAAIGWHRDKPVFGEVIGISLLSACRLRLRRKEGARWRRYAFTAEPRSAYLLRGAARTEWEHSIPAVPAARYSITFRQALIG